MQEITAQGVYNVPSQFDNAGDKVTYDYTYNAYDSLDDMIEHLKADKVFSLAKRQLKVDSNNTTREKVKADNGHSTRPVLSEEQKAKNKSERKADRDMLVLVKAGIANGTITL